jgi:Helicase associated domain
MGLEALERFVTFHGHARVPDGWMVGSFPLAEWLEGQREAARHGRLAPERVAELEALGVARVRRAVHEV